MSVHYTESKTRMGHDLAKQAMTILSLTYPKYSWFVRVDDGIMDIKCAQIGRASMIRRINDNDYSATAFRADIIRSAGEFLERARLVRGRGQAGYAKTLDGGKKIKWRPPIAPPHYR